MNNHKYNNLLIIRLSAMGDVAMTVPVLHSFSIKYPEVKITLLTNKRFTPMFRSMHNLNIVNFDKENKHKGFKGIYQLYKELKCQNFDAVLDFHGVLRSYILCFFLKFLSGVKIVKINKGRWYRFLLIKHGAQYYEHPLISGFRRYRSVFIKLGFIFKFNFKSIYIEKPTLSVKMQEAFGRKQRYWVGIAPFATHKGKILPLDKMEKVIKELQNNNIEMFFFGYGDYELSVFKEWNSKYSLSHLMPPKSGLDEELMLMANLDAMISMDSANMHLASLVNIPVISIWGATHHFSGFLGWNQSIVNIVSMNMDCRPCSIYGSKPCKYGTYACLNNIKPEYIIKRLYKIIDNKTYI